MSNLVVARGSMVQPGHGCVVFAELGVVSAVGAPLNFDLKATAVRGLDTIWPPPPAAVGWTYLFACRC